MENIMETQEIENKESFGDRALRTLCAFANTKGRILYIGVSDNGEVKGINLDNKTIKKISDKIVSLLGIHPEIAVEKREEKEVIKISVKPSSIPISFNGKYYERVGNTKREMNPERLKEVAGC
jgi:ATP-dependent DNA helicase RecG